MVITEIWKCTILDRTNLNNNQNLAKFVHRKNDFTVELRGAFIKDFP